MNAINASAAGRFQIGDSTINRLGYGAVRDNFRDNCGDNRIRVSDDVVYT
jgi:hypothetical protein